MPEQPTHRLNVPIVQEAIRSWYRSLAEHDLADVGGHLQGLGILVILLARMAPATSSALTDDAFARKLSHWNAALAELLRADDLNGGAR